MEDVGRTLQAEGKVLNREVQFRLKSGVVADSVISVIPVTIGAEACFVTLIRDITQEKQAQRVLAESEERSRQIAVQLQRTLDLLMDLIISIDAQGRFASVSAASQHILGYAPEEVIGHSYLDFIYPDDRASTTREAARVTDGLATITFQNRYVRKDGALVWLEWNAVQMPGDPLTYCVARDITERKAGRGGSGLPGRHHRRQP